MTLPQVLASATDPQTSHDAAKEARHNAEFHKQQVREAMTEVTSFGVTDYELEAVLPNIGAQKRRFDMFKEGEVVITERKRKAKKSLATVWVLRKYATTPDLIYDANDRARRMDEKVKDARENVDKYEAEAARYRAEANALSVDNLRELV